MINKSVTYRILGIILPAFCLLFPSCVEIEEGAEAVGYLAAPELEVDLTVDNLIDTKAVDLFDIPSVSSADFIVRDKDGKVKYEGRGPWTEALLLPVGSYTVEASVGSNVFGVPYFKAMHTGTIEPLDEEVPSIRMQLANALVRVGVGASLVDHFSLETVVLNSGGVEKTFSAEELEDWYYVPSGAVLSLTLSGTNSAGTVASYTDSFTPAAKLAYNVVCGEPAGESLPKINLPDQSEGAWAGRLYVTPAGFSNISEANQAKMVYELIPEGGDWSNPLPLERIQGPYYVAKGLTNGASYKIRARIGNLLSEEQTVMVQESLSGVGISSVHYKDGSGNLAGTNSTLSVALPGILGTLTDAGLLQITGYSLSNGSTEVRSAASAGQMTAASGWPYLPQGSHYVLTINHKLTNESATVSSTNTGFSSPSPTGLFTISTTSFTSYDRYLAGAIGTTGSGTDYANGCDASTLYNVGAKVAISDALLSNANYNNLKSVLKVSYNGDNTAVLTSNQHIFRAQVPSLTTASPTHTVSASFTFDGHAVSVSSTHYITGLPYTEGTPPRKDGVVYPWAQSQSSGTLNWPGDYVKLLPKRGSVGIKFDSFYVPSDKGQIYVSLTNVYEKKGAGIQTYTLKIGNDTPKNAAHGTADLKEHTYSGNHYIYNNSKSIEIYSNYDPNNVFGSYYYYVKSVVVLYAAQ